MCLYIDRYQHPFVWENGVKPRVHDKNILVYKYLQPDGGFLWWKKYRSPIMAAKYKLGQLYTLSVLETDEFAMCCKSKMAMVPRSIGFHSWMYWHGEHNGLSVAGKRFVRFPAIIPAGSLFYFGLHNDIISTSLIVLPDSFRHIKKFKADQAYHVRADSVPSFDQIESSDALYTVADPFNHRISKM